MTKNKRREGQLQRVLAALTRAPAAHSKKDAWTIISDAVEQVNAVDGYGTSWTIPALEAASSRPYGAGGIAIRLIGHYIYFNANGAYRILDISSGEPTCLFEKENSKGITFVDVPGYRMTF